MKIIGASIKFLMSKMESELSSSWAKEAVILILLAAIALEGRTEKTLRTVKTWFIVCTTG